MIDRAVVLCAGEGSRLRPLTFSKPKHLLPVAGKPILGWALDDLRAAGIRQVALVVGHQADAIRRYVGVGDTWGLEVHYIPQAQPLGIGHAVSLAREFTAEQPFLVYLGDNLFERGLVPFMQFLQAGAWEAALALKPVDNPRQFGVAQVTGDRVTGVIEKPADPPGNLAVVGIYAFRTSIFEAIATVAPSAKGELEITDAIARIIAAGHRVAWNELAGWWEDTGEPTALLRANRRWLLRQELTAPADALDDCEVIGPVGLDRGAHATRSRLIGPCRIGHNCIIEDSTIGPDVAIDEGCEIVNAHLRNCIVQRNSQIRHLPSGLVDSVLGEHVEIQGHPDQPTGHPLSVLMGDMSHLKARN